jgi:hypothetical protein
MATVLTMRSGSGRARSIVARQPLDVVGRIAVGRFGHAVEDALDLVKPEQEGT